MHLRSHPQLQVVEPPDLIYFFFSQLLLSVFVFLCFFALVRDITKLSGYSRSNDKTRLEQSNYSLASGRFPLQNAIYDNKLPFSRM